MAALLEASRHGKIDALQLLDADIHVRDRELRTALHFAAQGAHEDSARLLLLQRAEVDPVCAFDSDIPVRAVPVLVYRYTGTPNVGSFVLGCIEADFYNWRLILQHF